PTACYKHVDEVVRERGAIRSHRHDLMVHGLVVPGSLEHPAGTHEYRFRLESRPDRPPAVIEVRYTGLLPDAVLSATALAPFRRVQIIARGTLARGGGLDVIPDGIIAKRPYD